MPRIYSPVHKPHHRCRDCGTYRYVSVASSLHATNPRCLQCGGALVAFIPANKSKKRRKLGKPAPALWVALARDKRGKCARFEIYPAELEAMRERFPLVNLEQEIPELVREDLSRIWSIKFFRSKMYEILESRQEEYARFQQSEEVGAMIRMIGGKRA